MHEGLTIVFNQFGSDKKRIHPPFRKYIILLQVKTGNLDFSVFDKQQPLVCQRQINPTVTLMLSKHFQPK